MEEKRRRASKLFWRTSTPNHWPVLTFFPSRKPVWRCGPRARAQVPRLYGMYHAKGMLRNFHEFLRNIFAPLFEERALQLDARALGEAALFAQIDATLAWTSLLLVHTEALGL
eukprot:2625943-Pleurochrysis_carterae.AAC.1